jgi:hypothetical protein
MKIIGCGMAGLLAGNMLRHRDPVIYELQPSLPNNHSAVLRFRTSSVGDVLNIPFKKVTMIKAAATWKNPVADALAYAFKNTGTYRSDRSITAGITTADRWVAPPDLTSRMAARLQIEYGKPFDFSTIGNEPVISTLPMPVLMEELNYLGPVVSFQYSAGLNIKATIADCDAYVSLLCPDPDIPFSRMSITGDELIVESTGYESNDTYAKLCVSVAADLLGISDNKITDVRAFPQKYAKINPVDDTVRHNFMYWATDKFNIFSLGRFATWRPGLMNDDLVSDLRKIDGWIEAGHYAIARHR